MVSFTTHLDQIRVNFWPLSNEFLRRKSQKCKNGWLLCSKNDSKTSLYVLWLITSQKFSCAKQYWTRSNWIFWQNIQINWWFYQNQHVTRQNHGRVGRIFAIVLLKFHWRRWKLHLTNWMNLFDRKRFKISSVFQFSENLKRKFFIFYFTYPQLKRNAYSRWSSFLYCPMRNLDQRPSGRRAPLYLFVEWYSLDKKAWLWYKFEILLQLIIAQNHFFNSEMLFYFTIFGVTWIFEFFKSRNSK